MIKILKWCEVAWAALRSRSVRSFYDRISSIYDEVFVSHKCHAENILRILDDVLTSQSRKALVLDLACGTGILSNNLTPMGGRVVSMDISFASLCIIRQRQQQFNIIQADAGSIPIQSKSFDAVVCLGAWRHFEDIEKILKEISRILNQNGIFIVGYFPPAIAGIIHVHKNLWGHILTRLYNQITQKLGYQDRADFSIEVETEQLLRMHFKEVSTQLSGSTKHVLLAQCPQEK